MTEIADNGTHATLNTTAALDAQIASIMSFYYPQCVNQAEG